MSLIDRIPLLFLIAAYALTAEAAQAQSNVVVKRFLSGTGPNAVGMVDASEDTEVAGPQAIYAGENGDIYLLDQVNGRILRFDPKGTGGDTRSYELPADLQPTDMVVTRSHIMVWDGNIHALRAQGPDDAPVRGLDEVSTRDIDDEFAVSAFAQMGSQRPASTIDLLDKNTRAVPQRGPPPRTRQSIASRGEGPVVIDVIPSLQPRLAQMEVRRKDETDSLATLRIEVRDRLGAAEFLEIDSQGRMFVLIENIPSSKRRKATAFVAQFSSSGRLEAIYDMPLSESVALSRRFVTIAPDGEVYFLRTRSGQVDVVGVGSRVVQDQTMIEGLAGSDIVQAPTPVPKKPGFIAAVRPLTRQQVVQTALAFENVQWTVTPASYGRDPDMECVGFKRIRRPGYLIGKMGQEVRGVPYCWGCHGSLLQIGASIAKGTMAGNVCTKNDPRNDVVGVDCSAFVSATWGLAQHYTTVAIPSITTPIENAWDLQPGDALNKPGSHVMLFLRFTADRKAEVMEASPGACNGRVCRNVYPLSSILARGYEPVRFHALAGTDVVAQADAADETETPTRKGKARKKHVR